MTIGDSEVCVGYVPLSAVPALMVREGDEYVVLARFISGRHAKEFESYLFSAFEALRGQGGSSQERGAEEGEE